MAAVLESLETAVIGTDDDLRIDYLNTAAKTLLALSARQAVGAELVAAVAELAPYRARIARVLDDSAALTLHELELAGSAGHARRVELTVSPAPTGLVLEFTTLDRRLQISQVDAMRAQNLANREMIRGLAHEIKNPLGGLMGAAQLLEQQLTDPELRQYTGVITREAKRLRELVDGLLGPREPPHKQTLNVHEPLEHVATLTAAKLDRSVALTRDYDPSLPPLAADRDQLVQVFFNLVDNAVTALAGCGSVALVTRIERRVMIERVAYRQAVRVDIVDDGPGISQQGIARIFQPLVTTKAGGGMGLPLAQYLVALHDGVIDCHSRPGRTVFSVLLPVGSPP